MAYYEGETDDLSPKLVKQFQSAAKELGTMKLAKKMFKYWSDQKIINLLMLNLLIVMTRLKKQLQVHLKSLALRLIKKQKSS